MRLIGGEFRGRRLAVPDGRTTRPTSDRAREAIFNVLEHADWAPPLAGARVLDVFAGSGALGFEAMSRGAAFCLFVETDEGARGAIRDNVENLGLFGTTRVHRRDATQLGARPGGEGEAYQLAFLDPPYGKGLEHKALDCLASGNWLSKDALVVLERSAEDDDFATDVWDKINTKTYGAAQFFFMKQKIFIS